MITLFKNRLAYLSVSLVLLAIAFPLISLGTTDGPAWLWWAGLLALTCGGLIPPVQRLLFGPPGAAKPTASKPTSSTTTGDSQ